VWKALKTNVKILDRIKYGGSSSDPSRVTRQAVAALFELDDLFVGSAQLTTTTPGQTVSYSRVWGKQFGVVAVEARPTTQSLHFASIFEWMKPTVLTRRDDSIGLTGAEVLKVVNSCDYKVVAADAGFLLTTVVS
jgi:hypothetical protein